MAVSQRCRRTYWHPFLVLLMMMMTMTQAVSVQRSYRRRVGLLRSTNNLPTDPWQLFNISIRQTENRTEGIRTYSLLYAHHTVYYLAPATAGEVLFSSTPSQQLRGRLCNFVTMFVAETVAAVVMKLSRVDGHWFWG